jgi:hypothetical protein
MIKMGVEKSRTVGFFHAGFWTKNDAKTRFIDENLTQKLAIILSKTILKTIGGSLIIYCYPTFQKNIRDPISF